MSMLETSTHINAPPAQVFACVTDLAGAPGRIAAIKRLEVLTDGPVARGTRWRETRVMFGREATEEMEITDFDAGRGYATEAESCGCKYRCEVSVAPDGDGSRLTMRFGSTPMTLTARAMSVVMMPLMRKTIVKAFDKDLADIKRAVETECASAP